MKTDSQAYCGGGGVINHRCFFPMSICFKIKGLSLKNSTPKTCKGATHTAGVRRPHEANDLSGTRLGIKYPPPDSPSRPLLLIGQVQRLVALFVSHLQNRRCVREQILFFLFRSKSSLSAESVTASHPAPRNHMCWKADGRLSCGPLLLLLKGEQTMSIHQMWELNMTWREEVKMKDALKESPPRCGRMFISSSISVKTSGRKKKNVSVQTAETRRDQRDSEL